MRSRKPVASSQNENPHEVRGCRSRPVFSWLLAPGFWLLLPGFWLLLPGCAASKQAQQAERAVADYFLGDYGSARQRLEPLAQKTDENFVLNNVRLGSVALAQYDLDAAEA